MVFFEMILTHSLHINDYCLIVFSRDSLNQSLQLILHILLGSAAYLPMWKGNQVDGWYAITHCITTYMYVHIYIYIL